MKMWDDIKVIISIQAYLEFRFVNTWIVMREKMLYE